MQGLYNTKYLCYLSIICRLI